MDEKRDANDVVFGSYDDILKKVGGFGKFQRRSFAVLTLVYVAAAMNTLGYLFWAGRPDHWCDVTKPQHLQNVSDVTWKELVIPRSGGGDFDRCTHRIFNWSAWTFDDVMRITDDGSNMTLPDYKVTKCNKWKFDQSQYTSTVVMEVNIMFVTLFLFRSHLKFYLMNDFTSRWSWFVIASGFALSVNPSS